MSVAFTPGEEIGRGDLDIFLTDNLGNPTNAAEITFSLYYLDPGMGGAEVLVGTPNLTPVNPQVGEYYAALLIPSSAALGDYHIRWTFKELVSSPEQQVVQEFAVVADGTVVSAYTSEEQEMITSLRILLRDQNPDKFYHFRPPEHEGQIGQYNRIFGQIWEDAELFEYLKRAVDWIDSFPPLTHVGTPMGLWLNRPHWRTGVYWGAIVHACFALAMNWVADEFDYSIGGVSLSIEKSSKYESLKQNAESQFEKAIEAKLQTEKYIRGLQQPRFGIGVRSAFGPRVAKGVLSPRAFLSV